MRLGLRSPAKINLTLEVLYRRPDGFHQLKTVLQELAFHDNIYLADRPGGKIELVCNEPALPRDAGNLAYQAAALLQSLYAPEKGVRLELIKRIPLAAGLGGGSSNAATVLKGLNRLWDLFLPAETLAELGARLGSDVPFFIYGGTALAGGRGEQVKPLPRLPQINVLLVSPAGKALSAARVYGALNLDKIPVRPNTDFLVELLEKGCGRRDFWEKLFPLLCNDLEAPVFNLENEIHLLKEQLINKGLAALVSGSGPAIFVLSRDAVKLAQVKKDLLEQGHRVVLTGTAP